MPETLENDQIAKSDEGPLSPTGVRALQIAIVIMTIMIVVGIGVVIGRIIYMGSSPSTLPITVSTGKLASRHQLALPKGAKVEQTSLSGSLLLVRYTINTSAGHAKAGVVVYNLAKSRIVSHIDLSAVGVPSGD